MLTKMGHITIFKLIKLRILRSYQAIQIIDVIYNNACLGFLPSSVFCLEITHSLMNFAMIRLTTNRIIPVSASLALAVGSTIFLLFTEVWFRMAGHLYQTSLRLKEMLLASHSKIVRRKGKSFRQITINVGNFYKVERGTVLTYFNILNNLTMTMLLYEGI